MNKNIIFFILAISILSLIIVFPRLYENDKEETKIDWDLINTAKNLCIALCEYVKNNFTIENVCLSDKDTITGVYWRYQNISCYVNENINPCLEKGDIEIILYNNCSLKDIRFVSKK